MKMRHRVLYGLLVAGLCLIGMARADALSFVDTGDVALNGTTPSHGDPATSGGWLYDHAPLGSHYGIYSNQSPYSPYEGSLGIQLQGHGTSLTSPTFNTTWGIASVQTRLRDTSGRIDATSVLRMWGAGGELVQLGPMSGDYLFHWSIDNGVIVMSGTLPGLDYEYLPLEQWWTYDIVLTNDGYANFGVSVNDGLTWAMSGPIDHGISSPFSRYQVVVDRLSSGSQVAIADFDNLSFTVPEPASMTLLGLGLVGIAARKLRRRQR